MATKVQWLDYDFYIADSPNINWNTVPGVYIFAGLNSAGYWSPIFVGSASSLAETVPNHEKWPEAEGLGATHVHAAVILSPEDQERLKRRLVNTYHPTLNQP